MSCTLRKTALSALLLASLLIAGMPRRAHATPTEQIGFGTRGPGMGNAMVASTDALGSPLYNPAAGVLGTGDYEFGLGYTYAHLSIEVNDRDPNTLPVQGFWFAGAVPFDIGSQRFS